MDCQEAVISAKEIQIESLDREIWVLYNVVNANVNANVSVNREIVQMPRRVTMTDVAQEAGVSVMTVSRVVNNKADVSPATRQRVLAVIERLGYRPSGIARGLATKHTATLGVVVPDIANPFFASVVRGAENQAYAAGYSVFLCNTDEDPERELAVLQSLEEKRVDGLMLCASRLPEAQLQAIVEHFPAVVLLFRRLQGDCIKTVLIDDELGAQAATQHLLNAGHRNIGFLAGPPLSYSGQGRVRGYRLTMDAAGLEVDSRWIRHSAPKVEDGRLCAHELLSVAPELTAILCFNDLIAVGALQACAEMGKRIPDDLAIIGFDDIHLAALVTPPLTTCRIPQYDLGSKAMHVLLNQVDECEDEDDEIIIRPELIVRGSAP